MSHSSVRKVIVSVTAVLALLLGINVGVARAALPTTIHLTVHYFRDAGDYGTPSGATGPWNVWLWKDAPGSADDVALNAPNGNAFKTPTVTKVADSWAYSDTLTMDITGVTSVFTQLGFIVRLGLWDSTDIGFDRFINNIDPTTGKAEVWLKQGDKTVYTSVPRLGPGIKAASVDDFKQIKVTLNRAPASGTSGSNFTICPVATTAPGATPAPAPTACPSASGVPTVSSASISGSVATLTLGSNVTLGTNYYVLLKDKNGVDFGSQKTYSGKILTSSTFNASYVYSGNDLGTTYTAQNTKFRVWAPTASALAVRIYDSATSTTKTDYPMTKDVNGTWVATVSGDQKGKIYMYAITVDDRNLEAMDPYVRATTINGTRGVVVDLTATDPAGFTSETKPAFTGKPTDAIIEELHVRDLSVDATSGYPANQKGKFSALTNFGTTYCSTTAPAPVKPATPAGLTATAGQAKVYLNWTHVTGATGYKVFRGATATAATTATTALTTSNVNGYTDVTALNGTTYFYTVKATNTAGDSAAATAVSAKPAANAVATAMPTPTPSTVPSVSASPWTCPSANTVKTGMNEIKDLGVTHVELQPVYDFGSVTETPPATVTPAPAPTATNLFNWGYDPQNPNVPEGSYSSDASNPTTRITEYKQAVQAMHTNGLRVIMDVVYNHVMNPNTFSEESIVPGYFFRTDATGNLTNASGCGNDVASERPMVRKFIIDSVLYWAKQYHVDGFRFDILSLMDKDTFNALKTALNTYDSTILTLGEGWHYDATKSQLSDGLQTNQFNASQVPGASFFNDQMRDGVKGDTGNDTLPGYVNGLPDSYINQVINGIFGQTATNYNTDKASSRSWTASSPGQSINYVDVHDGLTLWDKLTASNTFGSTTAVLQKESRQAGAIVFLAQGVPFFQAGQEFFRTKGGDANSYKSADSVNSLKWNLAATNASTVAYYKGLIALRKAHPLLRLSSVADINARFHWLGGYGSNALGFYYDGGSNVGDSWGTIAAGINPNGNDLTMTLPSTGTWYVVANGTAAGTSTITTLTNTNKVTVPANSVVVVHN